jgi:hypothetical protein
MSGDGNFAVGAENVDRVNDLFLDILDKLFDRAAENCAFFVGGNG